MYASKIMASLELARHAPSVHNSQPWKVQVAEKTITVAVDWTAAVTHGDPTKRQTYISLGVFTEALLVALGAQGLNANKIDFKHDKVILALTESALSLEKNKRAKALMSRTTDRSIYRPTTYTAETLKRISNSGKDIAATLWLSTDTKTVTLIAKKTSQAINLAISSPVFRSELSTYLVEPWSHKQRGISVKSLYIPLAIAVLEPFILRHGIALSLEPKLERKRWDSASGLLFITTKGDLEESWFVAGRKYMSACLTLETLGISHATSAALVEASTFHEDIEDLLGTTERLQAVIRFGRGKQQRHHSPRVSVQQLLCD